MQYVKELEQMKIEYKSIPVPSDGVERLLPVIERAKKDRRRKVHITGYASLAAAAVLLLLFIPGMKNAFLMGGSYAENAAAPDSINPAMTETETTKGNGSCMDVQMDFFTANTMQKQEPEEVITEAVEEGALVTEEEVLYKVSAKFNFSYTAGNVTYDTSSEEKKTVEVTISEKDCNAINAEICLQMAEREVPFFEFTTISSEQEYYLNEEKLLVIVFRKGSLAPAQYGDITFFIPADVFSVTE